jgi:hypothetical protein
MSTPDKDIFFPPKLSASVSHIMRVLYGVTFESDLLASDQQSEWMSVAWLNKILKCWPCCKSLQVNVGQ